jgi:hypothetical protein
MGHRLWAVLAIFCFGLEGAGCAWKWKRSDGDEIVMPLQTGSTIQRRVVIPKESAGATKKPKKKKEPKHTEVKPSKPERKEVKPSEPKKRPPEPPEEESPTAPDRLR